MKKLCFMFLPVLLLMFLGSCDSFSNSNAYENLQATNDALRIELTVQSSILATQNAQGSQPQQPTTNLTPSNLAQSITPSPMPYPFVTNNMPFPSLVPMNESNIGQIVKIAELGTGMPVSAFWSPDGKKFAVATHAGIYQYDANTYQQISFFRRPIDRPFSPMGNTLFSPDGKYIATTTAMSEKGMRKDIVDLLDAQTGEQIISFEEVNINSFGGQIAFSPRSDIVAILEGEDISVWDISTGNIITKLETDLMYYGTNGMEFSPDGSLLVAAFRSNPDDTLIAWDTSNWKVKYDLRSFDNQSFFTNYQLGKFLFSPDSKRIYLEVGGIGLTIRDAVNGNEIKTIISDKKFSAHDMDISPDGSSLATFLGYLDLPDVIKIWDSQGSLLKEIPQQENNVHTANKGTIEFSPDGTKYLILSNDIRVSIFDLAKNKYIHTIQFYDIQNRDFGTEIVFSPESRHLLSASRSYNNWVWDVLTGNPTSTYSASYFTFGEMVFSPDGNFLAVSGVTLSDQSGQPPNDQLILLHTSDYQFKCALQAQTERSNNHPIFSVDSKYIFAESDAFIYIWDTTSCKLTKTLVDNEKWGTDRTNFVHSIAYSPDGQYLVSAHADGSLKIWSLPNGLLVGSFLNFPEQVRNELLFLPDGRLLSSLGSIWSMPDGKKISEDSGLAGYPHTISKDGKHLATCYGDEIRIIEVETGKIVFSEKVYSLLSDPSMAFSPDMTMFAINQTGIIEFWGVPK